MVRNSCKPAIKAAAAAGVFLSLLWISTSLRVAADNVSPSSGEGSVLTPAEQSLVVSVPYSSGPLLNRSGNFDTRFSVTPDLVWQDIYEKPRIITLTIGSVASDPRHAKLIGDVEAVFPIEAKYYFEAVADYDAYPRVSRQTVYDVGRGERSGLFAYHKRIIKISGQVLGIGDTYLFVTNNYEERLGKGSYGLKWNLEKSLDGKFYTLMGSWYLTSLRCDDHPCTYVRYFSHAGMTRRPPIPTSILAFFTAAGYRNLLEDFYQGAVLIRQAAARQTKSRKSNDLLTIH